MNRQQRRVLERERRRYWDRQAFSRSELVEMNTRAYLYGLGMAILAARDVLGLGPTRLNRIAERIREMHAEVFGDMLDTRRIPPEWLWECDEA